MRTSLKFQEHFMHTIAPSRRESLNMRILPETRALIDEAAEAVGKNRTEFILDAARLVAEDVLLNHRLLRVSPEAHEAFLAQLDQAPAPNPALRKTLRMTAPWDEKR
jgi:uncharacterized protein (DUF1778 family)